tara:strand:+ start:2283 stop:2714 length:432 start_codon:yes stop_codon:yes gene_type:complete
MARRKRATKKSSYRRRRMSGVGAMGSQITGALYTIAGAVAAGAVTKFLPATMNEKLKSAVPVVVGIMLPKYLKGNIGAGVGAGMVAAGGLKLVQSFGILNGIGAYGGYAGYQVPQVAGNYNNAGLMDTSYMTPSIAGMDEEGC